MLFLNRVRLPLFIKNPQFTESENLFFKANGEVKMISSSIRKIYDVEVDWIPESWHERLRIALSHTTVNVESTKHIGGIRKDGSYEIEYPDFLDYPTAPASFKANVTPFNAIMSNCLVCADLEQVVCVDDAMGSRVAGASFTSNVIANDSIFCRPFTITIQYTNTTYVQSAVINNNQIDITLKTGVYTASDVELIRYRVTCANGVYDEAKVTADIVGDLVVTCDPPTDLQATAIGMGGATMTWVAPLTSILSYEWQLYRIDGGVSTLVDTGTEPDTSLNLAIIDLFASTTYQFKIRSVCGVGDNSVWAMVNFDTLSVGQGCGKYILENTYIGEDPEQVFEVAEVTYLDCNFIQQTVYVSVGRTLPVCMAEYSADNPVYVVTSNGYVTITYEQPC